MGNDWLTWHADYDDPESHLSHRRREVQRCLRRWLDDAGEGPLTVVSACSGDGRDLLEVLVGHRRARDVRARLLEVDSVLAGRARAFAAEQRLDGVEVVEGDAGLADSYVAMVPADLVMWCGVFGNLTETDVAATIRTTRQLAAPGATVVWTRGSFAGGGRVEPTDAIRGWFGDAGFEELSMDVPADRPYRVGVHRYTGDTEPLELGRRFFSFR